MDVKTAFENFRSLEKKLQANRYARVIVYYDGATIAPADAAAERGNALGFLSEIDYNMRTSSETAETVDFLLAHIDELTFEQQREVKLFNRDREFMQSIPADEYVAFQVFINESEDVWHKAKAANDFAMFAPYLKKVFETSVKFAKYYRPNDEPYNTLLDQFEMGLTTDVADRFFNSVRECVIPLLRETQAKPEINNGFVFRNYPAEQQKKLSELIMNTEGLSKNRCILGETEHPFTDGCSNKDVRITTHYYEDNLVSSMYSVLHEGGHALYDLGSADEFESTTLSGGVSMGIHESQSRFFENIIGRSEAFCSFIFPHLQKLFPTQLSDVTAHDFFLAVNKAQPSLIRTEADELTYSLHILIRYEIEKAVINGEVEIDDLPRVWNEKYKQYLGVDVPDDTHGVLQDVHWSGGMIGYFPSYALGSAYGAQILHRMKQDIDVDGYVSKGDLSPVTAWLKEHIFRFGSLYDPIPLLENCVGEKFDPSYFTRYLTEKYTKVYGL